MDSSKLMEALQLIEKQRGIDREEIFQAIENSLISACKKNFGTSQNIKVDINRETGEVNVYAQKEVTEDVYDAFLEISLEDAKEINPNYEYGDLVDIPVTPRNFGRISAQAAKQVVVQKFREAEREKVYRQYVVKQNDIDTGVIRRIENKNVVVSLGPIDVVIPPKEQVATESYNVHDRLKVYITQVTKVTKGARITGSRSHPDLVKRLFELEVPEIYDGTIEIKGIAREAGYRSKMAVYSKNPNVDAIGSCIGSNSNRINAIIKEIRGEKIDIINWSEDTKSYIAEALKPCDVLAIDLNQEERTAKVIVPDNQLSLGIGKEGQNVRLAARLTGWKIDIKSEEQARLTNFVDFDNKEIYIKQIEENIEDEDI
ncbi:transcription termination factor NusA [uncultured Tyzzerella sp.]|uniref:transcription termination factor NusA n=1 Tax=uncultured Tyzzerella sp. TaxID=2321398 RepID=UPI0029427BC2|nr:transcription termination factor NusA [uncultured Tyzzerella sp.]